MQLKQQEQDEFLDLLQMGSNPNEEEDSEEIQEESSVDKQAIQDALGDEEMKDDSIENEEF